tara:strand:+ start:68 stop:481 length:414 start_codon:yes stop_codon:yes gene_type:complete
MNVNKLDSINNIDELISLISDENIIAQVSNTLCISEKEAKLYLSAFIFYKFPDDESECEIQAFSLCEYFTLEKLNDYRIALDNYKRRIAVKNLTDLENTNKDFSYIQSNDSMWNILFNRQKRIVDIARDYFEKIVSK